MRHRVLCVDDDELILKVVTRMLQANLGVEVITASSVRQARRILGGEEGAVGVVLTDYRMPHQTGLDLVAALAQEQPDVVPVMMTSDPQLEAVVEAARDGRVFAVVPKPANREELLFIVRRAIERFELGRALRERVETLTWVCAELEQAHRRLDASNEEIVRLCELAYRDLKTGVGSYLFMAERIEEEVQRARRYRHPFSLVLIDLDGFKQVNDQLGHPVGDVVLKAFADLLRDGLRTVDVVARYGGDEFAVLLPDTGPRGAAAVCQRLGDKVHDARFGPAERGAITTSMGVASIPELAVDSGEQLLKLADAALYQAKRAGGDCCKVAGPRRLE